MPNPAVIRAAVLLSDEPSRKNIGWVIVAVLSPVILLAAVLCSLGAGASSHNATLVELCFNGGILPDDTPAEYVVHIENMRNSFVLLDACISAINENAEEGKSLDGTRVKAIFYALYFGPVSDLNTVYQRIESVMGITITDDQKANADSIYNLIRYGYSGGVGIGGTDAPFIGADGFCSPVGENWRNIVTSEFGYRKDPFTGQTKGHSGMDLAVPTGTSVRAALPGTVTVSQYSSSYGYYVMIDHGGGLSTLYAHNSKLLVSVGQTVSAGDVVSLSGSTGRSTGPHLHFEVRVNGERTDPRSYLP